MKKFKTKYWLEQHVQKMHPTPRQLNCKICQSYFANKPSLDGHIRKFHKQNSEGFSCSQCDMVEPTENRLERHKLKEHISRICNKCDKILDNGRKWVLHRKTCTKKPKGKTVNQEKELEKKYSASDSFCDENREGGDNVTRGAFEVIVSDSPKMELSPNTITALGE